MKSMHGPHFRIEEKPKQRRMNMEKYFVITEQSSLHKEWFAYKENVQSVRELVKKFTRENEIEDDGYFANNDALFIIPSEKDGETFKNLLCSPLENGLRKFKTSSKIGKAWVKAVKEAELKILHKPMVILYFNSLGGRFKSRLFDQDGVLYCSLDPVHGETPKGFIEIKASEFFKIIEESENVPA